LGWGLSALVKEPPTRIKKTSGKWNKSRRGGAWGFSPLNGGKKPWWGGGTGDYVDVGGGAPGQNKKDALAGGMRIESMGPVKYTGYNSRPKTGNGGEQN